MLQGDFCAQVVLAGVLQGQLPGGSVLHGHADGFEEGDLLRVGASWLEVGGNFAQFGDNVFLVDEALLDGDNEVAGFFQGGFYGIHHDKGAAHGVGVNFLHGRGEGADAVDVDAGLEVGAGENGCVGGGGGANDVGLAHGRCRVTHNADQVGNGADAFHLPGKKDGVSLVGAVHAHFPDVPHGADRFQLGASLDTAAQNSDYRGIRAGQQIGGGS